MRTALFLLVFAFLLTGCTEGEDPGLDGGAPMDAPEGEVREPLVRSWEGILTGVGFTTDASGPVLVGSFRLPEMFRVPADAAAIEVEMVLDGPVTSSDVFLRVWSPDAAHSVGALPDALPGAPLVFTQEEPPAGDWEAMGFLEGVGAEQAYTITATVTFA